MKVSVTGAQMKQIDADTIERIGIPSMVLMERAALAVAEAVERIAAEAGFSCGGSAGPGQAGGGRAAQYGLRGRPAPGLDRLRHRQQWGRRDRRRADPSWQGI